jgi:hypothetical protein
MINMIEFIKWSFGPGARAALFAGMPMNPQGRLFAASERARTDPPVLSKNDPVSW